MSAATDVPMLTFVDPAESSDVYRVVLWAAPGEGKSVAAASAPDPIVVLSADRPGAYRFARAHHRGKDIREVRYQNSQTLSELWKYLRDHDEVRTLIVDPFGNIYDRLAEEIGGNDLQPEHYQLVNKRLLGFLKALRDLPIHVVLVAHERLNDGKKGDGLLYPALGGPALINKVLAEMDLVAHISRQEQDDKQPVWMGQLTRRGHMVAKDSTGALGDRRAADLTEWFATASSALAVDHDPLWDDPAYELPLGGEA